MAILKFLEDIGSRASTDLGSAVEIRDCEKFPKVSDLVLDKPVWHRIRNATVVATDLKGSTRISYSRQDKVGARLYEASTANCARILSDFGAEFIDIQGDGLFAIFHGEHAVGRATAAAFTLKSFSVTHLAGLIDEKLAPDLDLDGSFESGLKVGIDAGTLLAKMIGVRGTVHREPVWAGKPVNYATKCAQAADRHQIVVSDRFFKLIESNEYARYSCGCSAGQPSSVSDLWTACEVETLGDDAPGHRFNAASSWCVNHGDDFAEALRTGKAKRADDPASQLPADPATA